MIKTKCFSVGELQANCYFVTDEKAGVSLLVDTGSSSDAIEKAVEDFGTDKLRYILLTHGHFDHIGSVAYMKRKYPQAKIVIGEKDADFTQKDNLNLSLFFDGPLEHFKADILVNDGDELPFGEQKIQVIATPGHTAGGMCYVIDDSIFTGDTLISCTTGRTDFPTGSPRDMIRSMTRLAQIPEDLSVYCGHGESSTLDFERLHNAYMRNGINDDIY